MTWCSRQRVQQRCGDYIHKNGWLNMSYYEMILMKGYTHVKQAAAKLRAIFL